MADKITLRLKSDPSVVLPEGVLVRDRSDWYVLDLAPDSAFEVASVDFPKRDWEPVPPPYVLPTGIGAVVQFEDGSYVVRADRNLWVCNDGRIPRTDEQMLKWVETEANFKVSNVSEGVTL